MGMKRKAVVDRWDNKAIKSKRERDFRTPTPQRGGGAGRSR